MTDRTGWHCTTCNHYFQTASETPPNACRYCGASGTLRRIDHAQPAVDVAVGEVVSCEIIGETREFVVGEVVAVESDRLVVEARDGTGRYVVKPTQIVEARGTE